MIMNVYAIYLNSIIIVKKNIQGVSAIIYFIPIYVHIIMNIYIYIVNYIQYGNGYLHIYYILCCVYNMCITTGN